MSNCLYCNKSIPIIRSRDKNKRFCNRACSSRYLFKAPLIKCLNCEKEISSAKYRKFCNYKCHGEYRRSKYEKKCPVCNEKFILYNRAYEKRGKGKYCSKECYHKDKYKYFCNNSFFENINCEIKAYWLGFIYADGYNSGYELVIRLSSIDEEHLKIFRDHIESNNNIITKFEKNKNFKNGGKYVSSIRIARKNICNNLTAIGCIKAKSLIIRFPRLEKHLIRHFLRGYFDGDGCITHDRRGFGRAIFYSGSLLFIDDIEKILLKQKIYFNRGKKDKRFLTINRMDDLLKLYYFLYKDSTVKLDRKYKKFFIFINKIIHIKYRKKKLDIS